MPEFINTIDLLGDDAVIDSIIDRTITEFKDDQITQVETRAFTSCKELQLVDLPSVTGTGFYAFQDCTSLKHVNLPLASRAHQYCFAGCTSLTEIVLPAAIDINNNAFYGCTNLKKLDAPMAKNIRLDPFSNCSSLKALILRERSQICALQRIGTNSSIEAGTGFIYVPGNLVNSYRNATNWSTYKEQFRGILDDEDALQGIIDETLVDYENNEIESIPERAFYKYAPLESVKSTSAIEIGAYAFYNCQQLTQANFPNVTDVQHYAFQDCKSLQEVNLPNLALSSSRNGLFYGCSSLTKVSLPLLQYVGWSMFRECCALEQIDLPIATFINDLAFRGSDKTIMSLESVILRSETICKLSNISAFEHTPIANGIGYIYVPRALIEDYKVAENWSTYAAQFRALEDYTVDGTTTGELDESKI